MKKQGVKINNKNLLILTLVLFILFSANQSSAFCDKSIVPCGRFGTPPCTFCHFFQLANNILEFILNCMGPIIGVLMLVACGVIFMLSQFEVLPGNIFTQAKDTVTSVVIGIIIIFGAWVVLNTFLTTAGIAQWTGLEQWWEIKCSLPVFCTQCSDCAFGEYCDQQTGACLEMPVCAKCNADYGYVPQNYDEDIRQECATCQTCSGSGTGFSACVPGPYNVQSIGCNGLCQACQSGVCRNASDKTDPGNYCNPDPQYNEQEGGDPIYCQERVKSGNCNAIGSCDATYGKWQNINENLVCETCKLCIVGQCTDQTTNWGDDLYSCLGPNNRCDAGTCVTGECTQCSDCPIGDGLYCEEFSGACLDLPLCTECNSGFGYNLQEDDEDWWDDCTQGSASTDGCRSDLCDGAGSCGIITSGDGGCPTCYTCQNDGNIDCEYHTSGTRDSGCLECKECNGAGSCNQNTPDTNWGDGDIYGCSGSNKRCRDGACVACTQCSDCPNGSYCEQSSVTCLDLPLCTECNSGFGYNLQEDDEDWWDDCTQGSASINGCRSDLCDGAGSCGIITSGDGGCPMCYGCTDGDIACEAKSAYSQDSGCTSRCRGCLSGSCVNIPNGQKDTWGSQTCTATHYRCNGSGFCTAPLGPIACMSDWFGGLNTCTQRCGWAGYDLCYSSCNATINCVASWSATCGYSCGATLAEECQCRNYLYD